MYFFSRSNLPLDSNGISLTTKSNNDTSKDLKVKNVEMKSETTLKDVSSSLSTDPEEAEEAYDLSDIEDSLQQLEQETDETSEKQEIDKQMDIDKTAGVSVEMSGEDLNESVGESESDLLLKSGSQGLKSSEGSESVLENSKKSSDRSTLDLDDGEYDVDESEVLLKGDKNSKSESDSTLNI